jgi:hypothetical protein
VRRIATWLLVGALAALGLAAAVDALRDEQEIVRPEPEATAIPGLEGDPGEVSTELRHAGVSGVLTYSDEDCRLHAVSLPDLEPARAPSFQMCRPLTDSGGLGVSNGAVVWAGLGLGVIQEVVSRKALSRAIRDRVGGADYRAVQAVTLGEERYLVLAEPAGGDEQRVVVGFDGERALFVQPGWRVGGTRLIRTSPDGSYYALLGRERLGDQLYDRNGRGIGVPPGITGVQSVAWSPDGRWTALGTESSVFLYPSDRSDPQLLRIPLTVQDLDWSDDVVFGLGNRR